MRERQKIQIGNLQKCNFKQMSFQQGLKTSLIISLTNNYAHEDYSKETVRRKKKI